MKETQGKMSRPGIEPGTFLRPLSLSLSQSDALNICAKDGVSANRSVRDKTQKSTLEVAIF